ncbi:TetR/AcrR family transcriptional regulator [Dactylosporangium aurantiacum]|uniref:TetR/AcrR family transcriptional regulator n=1 Tax=Dactylosporangium aurantiacum TaxID=35754 RepID=A0A9Q9IRE1_9ACTN|nr:TetR/AcrR family transcriptional regulator [Dactylosporangium aurantiacum]MDG6105790.1 TetR family transcriptional regulator [Dactylosporangium aurantiacum]UWZ58024.1 TetR/AcrR family transcriptional regulator [Dactylosporangium aurantiacum]
MGKRADNVTETRQRIVEAAVALHGTIGPAATTVSAVAEAAGVTRLTVYRHFPDDGALFAAAGAHWAAGQVPPDLAAWARAAEPFERLAVALTDLYRFYRDGEPMLTNVIRDRATLPAHLREAAEAGEAQRLDLLLRPFRARGTRRRRLRAAIGHAASFWTWRSLCHEHGLSDADAVRLTTALVSAAAS